MNDMENMQRRRKMATDRGARAGRRGVIEVEADKIVADYETSAERDAFWAGWTKAYTAYVASKQKSRRAPCARKKRRVRKARGQR